MCVSRCWCLPVTASMSSPCMPNLSSHSVLQIRRCSVSRACHEPFGSVLLGKSSLVTFFHGSDLRSFSISSQLYGLLLLFQPHCGWNSGLFQHGSVLHFGFRFCFKFGFEFIALFLERFQVLEKLF